MASVRDRLKKGGAKGLPRSLDGLIDAIDEEIAAAGAGPIQYIHIRDEKANGTDGGDFTSGAYRTRDLNTIVTDDTGVVTLVSNQFGLPDGDFIIRTRAPAFDTTRNKAKLRNITDASDEVIGANAFAAAVGDGFGDSWVLGKFTVSGGPKLFEIQHRCEVTKALGLGFGVATSFGDVEVYTEVWLEKVA